MAGSQRLDIGSIQWNTTPEERKSEAGVASTEAGTARTTALTPLEIRLRKLQADALERRAKADVAKQEAAATAAKVSAQSTQEDTNRILAKLAEARRLVSGWSTGWGSYLSALPETQARALRGMLGPDGTIGANVLLEAIKKMRAGSASGATGLGAMDRSENQTLKSMITNLDLARKPEEVLRSINDIDRYMRRYAAITSGQNPDDRDVAIQFGLVPPEDKKVAGPPPKIGGVTSEENVDKPEHLRGLNVTVAKMLREGRSADDIKTYLNSVEPGLGDRTRNLDWWATEMQKPQGATSLRPEDYINMEEIRTQASAPEKAIGAVAETPAGTALLGATDFATAGLLPQFTSNPEATRAAIKGAELEAPNAFMLGQMAGGITGGMGAEALAAKYGLKLTPAVLSALQSGAYGYGTSENEGLDAIPDALLSAGMGYAGGKGGELLGRGIGTVAQGSKDIVVQGLRQRGVPLTLGEILGGKAGAVEARLSKLPIVGPAISARLGEGEAGFNRAAFEETLGGLGEKYRDFGGAPGARGLVKARQNVSRVFKDALKDVTLTQDDVFQRNVADAWTQLGELPDVGPKVLKSLNDQLGELLKPGRNLTGEEVQVALRKLNRIGSSYKNNELYESSIAPRLRTVEDEIRGVVERQAPDVLPQYDAARDAWRKVSVLGEAVKKATRGEAGAERGLFTPEELQAAGMANAEKFTGKGSSVTRGYPFQELSEAGIDVLTPRGKGGSPYTLPLTTAGLVGGASYLAQPGQTTDQATGAVTGSERDPMLAAMLATGAAGLTALPYSRLGQRTLTNLLLGQRGPTAQRLGDLVAKYGPGAGAGIGAAYFGGAPSRGTPDVSGYPMPAPEPITVKPLETSAAPSADVSLEANGLGAMPSVSGLPEGVQFDPATSEFILADGTRVPASSLAGVAQ